MNPNAFIAFSELQAALPVMRRRRGGIYQRRKMSVAVAEADMRGRNKEKKTIEMLSM